MSRLPNIPKVLSATAVMLAAFFCGCSTSETDVNQDSDTLTASQSGHDRDIGEGGEEGLGGHDRDGREHHGEEGEESGNGLTLDGGYVETGMNEVSIVSTVDDPPGLRLGVKREEGWGRSLGKFSFNSVRPDRVQDECVLIQGKLDERYPFTDLVGEYIFFLRTPPGGGDEGDMVKVLTLQHDRIVAHVPMVFEQGGEPIPAPGVRP